MIASGPGRGNQGGSYQPKALFSSELGSLNHNRLVSGPRVIRKEVMPMTIEEATERNTDLSRSPHMKGMDKSIEAIKLGIEALKATPRANIIERLRKDAPQAALTSPKGDVLLCFTCDPYQPIDTIHRLTRQAIEILHDNNFTVAILTKGGKRAERDFDLLSPKDSFAVTLTFLDEQNSIKWEPKAAIPEERIESLKKAHDLGIKTWVSLEPVINPDATMEVIRQTHTFVDLYKVGKINYHKIEESIDWSMFLRNVKTILEAYGSQYYIKKDLRVYG